jgi:hypothetical protein
MTWAILSRGEWRGPQSFASDEHGRLYPLLAAIWCAFRITPHLMSKRWVAVSVLFVRHFVCETPSRVVSTFYVRISSNSLLGVLKFPTADAYIQFIEEPVQPALPWPPTRHLQQDIAHLNRDMFDSPENHLITNL